MSGTRDDVGDERVAPPLVLIAEDEESIAEVVEMLVAEAGYGTVVARDGRQALALAREHWPALLITDMMMPHLDGIDLIAALRAEAADSSRGAPPAILMTAASISYARGARRRAAAQALRSGGAGGAAASLPGRSRRAKVDGRVAARLRVAAGPLRGAA